MSKPLNVILLGLSGSGKGTQARLLKELLEQRGARVHLITTGDLVRALAKKESMLGKMAKQGLDEGKFHPTSLVIALWGSYLTEHVQEEDTIIFDGSPRKLREAEFMDELLHYMGRRDSMHVIFLKTTPEEVTKRLVEGRKREDDTPAQVESRIGEYEKDVVPVLEYYRKQNRLIEINGTQSVEGVHKDIVAALGL